MEPENRRFDKGFFTRNRFPVSEKYPSLTSRKRLFVMGALAAFVLTIVFLADAFVGRASTIASGPLSESHALFGKDCSTCHEAVKGATDANCQSCHQRGGKAGVYTFARHYQYHSGLTDRTAPVRKEASCGSCHREHRGRENTLQAVADKQCSSCHEVKSLKKHPDFEFATKKNPDPSNLKFAHVKHIREVMEERDIADAEEACLTCHVAKPDGRNFEPLNFDVACADCHLGNSAETPFLPTGSPGVVSLGQIRASGRPGTNWSFFWNPNEFTEDGGIQKRPVYHEDPWVLYNLRRLRGELYPGSDLADLLTTSPDVPAHEQRALREEAVNTLRQQIETLRGNPSPDVQAEVKNLNAVLEVIEARLAQPYAPFDETRFAVRTAEVAPGVDQAAYTQVINDLTAPCQECHVVENATIKRVQADQRSLVRAQFNHRAHIVHARCLDCHNQIPIRDALKTEDDVPENKDNAAIVNLPNVASCRTCHSKKAAPAQCTSCHLFHPDKAHLEKLTP